MLRAADAARSHVELAGMRLEIIDELGKRFDRHGRMDDENPGALVHAGDGDEVAQDVELEVFVEGGVPGIDRGYVEQGIAVGPGADDVFGGNIARRAGSILD